MLIATLARIRRTPLDRITADQVAEVVRVVVKRESDVRAVAVAAFGSSI
jgi:hypothetical protein